MKLFSTRLKQNTKQAVSPTRPSPVSPRKTLDWAEQISENLKRNVLAEHERDLAMLPPEVRASRTPEEWFVTPPLEILKLVSDSRAKASTTTR